jgi:hypothetical protein
MGRREPRLQRTFSIDDPMATYGQKNVPVSVAPKKAPIVNVDVEFPFSVKTMDFQRWMS